MFYSFPYRALDFTQDQWDAMPRVERVLIRDYYLNGRDTKQTAAYGEYDTPYQVWKIIKKYDLKTRAAPMIKLCEFHLY